MDRPITIGRLITSGPVIDGRPSPEVRPDLDPYILVKVADTRTPPARVICPCAVNDQADRPRSPRCCRWLIPGRRLKLSPGISVRFQHRPRDSSCGLGGAVEGVEQRSTGIYIYWIRQGPDRCPGHSYRLECMCDACANKSSAGRGVFTLAH